MAEWSRRRKLALNTSKCEAHFFTNNSKEARWQPVLQLNGTLFNITSLPKFLEVTIYRALSFGPHVAAVISIASTRCRVLASLTSRSWGWGEDQHLKAYRAFHLSVINAAKTEHSASLSGSSKPPPLRPSEWRRGSRTSQRKPNNKPS